MFIGSCCVSDCSIRWLFTTSEQLLMLEILRNLSNSEQRPVCRKAPSMMGNQKQLIILVWMLLVATLCPWVHCKRGGSFGSRGKGVGLGSKAPPSHIKGSSKQGLKLAGAAAAGALGGAAIGYGLGSLGRQRYGYSEEDRRYYYPDGTRYHNRTDWQYYRNTASSKCGVSILIFLGTVTHIFMWN